MVSSAVMERQPAAYYELDAQLTKNKPNLISLLQHAVSNSKVKLFVYSRLHVRLNIVYFVVVVYLPCEPGRKAACP